MKIFLLLPVMMVFALPVVAQPTALQDSLLKLLSAAKADTQAVQWYIDLGNTYDNNDPATARGYYQKAGQLCHSLGYDNGWQKYFVNMAGTFMVEGNMDSALFYTRQGLDFAEQHHDSLNIGMALFNMGIFYRELSQFENAITYCLRGRAIMEAKGNEGIELQMNDALQILYYTRTEYDKAIEFGEKAVRQSRKLKMKNFLAQSLLNLSLSYLEKKEVSRSEVLIREALQLAKELKDIRLEATALQNLAAIYVKKGDFSPPLKSLLERSLALSRQIGSASGESLALRAMAIYNLQQRDYNQAKIWAEQASVINRRVDYKQEEASVMRILAIVAYASQDVTAGFRYETESQEIMEALIKDLMSEKAAELEKKYESEKQEIRIRKLEADKLVQQLTIRQKNSYNYILAGSAAILLILSLLAYRNYKQKQLLQQQRITELETEKQLTATEAVLKGEEQERTRLAKDLHDGLGGMLSGIKYALNTMKGNLIMTPDNAQAFERSMDMLDSSIQEMRRVAHNMMPEALVRFGLDTALKDFCNDIHQSGALAVHYQSIGLEGTSPDQTTAITIYRVVQELVSNAMKHAAAKNVIVQVSKTNERLTIAVEDDGKGFDTGLLQSAKGIGWSNVKNRVDFLKGRLDINAHPGSGTSVLIELPV